MHRFIFFGAIAFAMTGCFDKEATDDGLAKSVAAVAATVTANNSPDVTVKSWWRVKDAAMAVRIETCKNNLKVAAPYFGKLSSLSSNERYSSDTCVSEPFIFDRQITKVDVQSETRSVVTARIKNATPPEEGAVLDAAEKKAKEAGEPYRYVLERKDSNSGWKITEIANFPSYAKDWVDVSPKPTPSNNRFVYDLFQ